MKVAKYCLGPHPSSTPDCPGLLCLGLHHQLRPWQHVTITGRQEAPLLCCPGPLAPWPGPLAPCPDPLAPAGRGRGRLRRGGRGAGPLLPAHPTAHPPQPIMSEIKEDIQKRNMLMQLNLDVGQVLKGLLFCLMHYSSWEPGEMGPWMGQS